MADYRDELRAAHDRIAQLERERRTPPADAFPPRKVHPLVWVFATLATATVLFGGLAAFVVVRSPYPMSSVYANPASPSPPAGSPLLSAVAPPLGLQWYPQRRVKPIFADLDMPADGKNEIIGLAWDAAHDDAPLHVVAIDRTTYRVRWHAGPYPAHWQSDRIHLVRVGDRLTVTDSRELVHVLDIRTGKEVRTPIAVDREFDRACAMGDGSARLLVNEGFGQLPPSVVDLETGTLTKGDGKSTCSLRFDDDACPSSGIPATGTSCGMPGDAVVDRAVSRRPTYQGFWSSEVLAQGDHRVAVGMIPNAAVTEAASHYAAAFEPKSKKILWTTMLAPETDAVDKHPSAFFLNDLDDDQLYIVYETGVEPMPYRLVARNLETGDLRYNSLLEGTAEGSYLSSIAIDGTDVFIVVNSTLVAFDRKTGAPTFRLTSF